MNTPETGERKVVTTCTRDCPGCCGLVARVRGGRVTRLSGDPDHPLTRGRACAKTRAYLRRMNHPDRVTEPLLRGGKSGRRAPVSWDAALDLLAEKLHAANKTHGPESVLFYQGYGERTALTLVVARFFALFGGVTTLRGSLCSGTAIAAQNMDLGERISHDPLDHANARTIVLWGRNPVATQAPLVPVLRKARAEHGGPLVVVDPLTTPSARMADLHIRPRPGTDGFLALAAARMILDRSLEDRDFLTRCTENAGAFLELLGGQDTGALLAACDVPEADALALAEAMALRRPAAVLLGWGLHRHVRAHWSVRAIDALAALTGNFGVPGGGVSQGFDEFGPWDPEVRGEHLHPPRRTFLVSEIGREIIKAQQRRDPPVEVAVIAAGNPAAMAPDSTGVARALDSIPFVAHVGHFLDDTSDHADLFLPSRFFLEEDDLVTGYGHNWAGPVNKVREAPGQCRSMFAMFRDLARRFPFGPELDLPADVWLKRLARPLLEAGVGMEELRAGAVRQPWTPMVPYEGGVFPTPTGRFRFLEEFRLPPQSPPPGRLRLLTTGSARHLCSERTNDDHEGLPVVRLHPDSIRAAGLHDGDAAELVGDTGRLAVRVATDSGLRPDTAAAERGGWVRRGHGMNVLVPARTSEEGEGTPFYETWVAVRPLEDDPAGG